VVDTTNEGVAESVERIIRYIGKAFTLDRSSGTN
jgi:hypothetical protein